jgi:hypothetical protein
MTEKKKTNHYVDNKQLQEVMVEYKTAVLEAEEKGLPAPRVPEYVGECVLQIANRLSTKPNFINYSYREEMISDGIENCMCYINNYDPFEYSNPFAYFTQIIYYAFLRRIQKEKKQLYVKHKALENSMIMDELVEQNEFDDNDYGTPTYIDVDNANMAEFVEQFEASMKGNKPAEKKGVEKFFDEDQKEELSSNKE